MGANLFSTIGLYGQIGGALIGAFGAYSSAKGAKANAQMQANISKTNARIAEIQAKQAVLQGHHQAFARTLKAGQRKASQRAIMSANGVRLNSGSAAEVLASEDVVKDWDMKTIEDNALMHAWGYRSQAINYQGEASSTLAMANGISPLASGANSLLSSAGQVAGAWYQYQKNTPSQPSYTSQNLGRVVGMNTAFNNAGLSAFAPSAPFKTYQYKGSW